MSAQNFSIIGIGMVRNEEDIIEGFIRHNLQYVDALVLLDNGSFDDTRNIIKSLQQEGLNVFVTDDNNLSYLQAEKITALYQRVATSYFPDFILPLDADEFIQAASPQEFKDALYSIPSDHIGLYRWKTYIPNPNCPPKTLSDITFRRNDFFFERTKIIIRCDGCVDEQLFIESGYHHASKNDVQVAAKLLESIHLAHFTLRSPAHLFKTTITKWIGRLHKGSSDDIKREASGIYTRIHNIISDGLPSAKEVSYSALNFGQPIVSIHSDIDKYICEDTPALHPQASKCKVDALQSKDDVIRFLVQGWTQDVSLSHKEEPLLTLYEQNQITSQESKSNGAFSPEDHLKTMYADIPPFKYIHEILEPESVLDVGCGLGTYLRFFKIFGSSEILGIDGLTPQYSFLQPEEYIQQDLTQHFDLQKQYDLVCCLEVAEHLPNLPSVELVKSLCRHSARHILFSAASPGQGGHGHINCQPLHFWAEIFTNLGWSPLVGETLFARCCASLSWFRKNMVLLQRNDAASIDDWKQLLTIAEAPHQWVPGESRQIFEVMETTIPTNAYPQHQMKTLCDPDLQTYSLVADVYNSALNLKKQQLSNDIANPSIWAELGELYLQGGAFDDAQECFEKAIQLAPDDIRFKQLLTQFLKARLSTAC